MKNKKLLILFFWLLLVGCGKKRPPNPSVERSTVTKKQSLQDKCVLREKVAEKQFYMWQCGPAMLIYSAVDLPQGVPSESIMVPFSSGMIKAMNMKQQDFVESRLAPKIIPHMMDSRQFIRSDSQGFVFVLLSKIGTHKGSIGVTCFARKEVSETCYPLLQQLQSEGFVDGVVPKKKHTIAVSKFFFGKEVKVPEGCELSIVQGAGNIVCEKKEHLSWLQWTSNFAASMIQQKIFDSIIQNMKYQDFQSSKARCLILREESTYCVKLHFTAQQGQQMQGFAALHSNDKDGGFVFCSGTMPYIENKLCMNWLVPAK